MNRFECPNCGQTHPYEFKLDGTYPRDTGWERVAPITQAMVFALLGVTCPTHQMMLVHNLIMNKGFIVYAVEYDKIFAVYNHDGNYYIITHSDEKMVERYQDRQKMKRDNQFQYQHFLGNPGGYAG